MDHWHSQKNILQGFLLQVYIVGEHFPPSSLSQKQHQRYSFRSGLNSQTTPLATPLMWTTKRRYMIYLGESRPTFKTLLTCGRRQSQSASFIFSYNLPVLWLQPRHYQSGQHALPTNFVSPISTQPKCASQTKRQGCSRRRAHSPTCCTLLVEAHLHLLQDFRCVSYH